MDRKVVAFLLSVDTDVEIMSGEVASLISSLISKTMQIFSGMTQTTA